MTIVLDASVVVAALLDNGPEGQWAETILLRDELTAPHIMPEEVTRAIRRAVIAGDVSEAEGAKAFADLSALPVTFLAFRPVASRIWDLRRNVSVADAWYVAVAEDLNVELATLDRPLTRAPGPRCRFLTPPDV